MDDKKKEEIKAGELLKEYIEYSEEITRLKSKPDLISVTKSGNVEDSDSLAMRGLDYLPLPSVVGGCHYPVVFNNSCSSWRALALKFSAAGSSVYVGTSAAILNVIGVETAQAFIRRVTAGRTVGFALHDAQRKFVQELGYTPYLMTGYIYTHVRNPPLPHRRRRVELRIRDAIHAATRQRGSEKMATVTKFLKDELKAFANVRIRR